MNQESTSSLGDAKPAVKVNEHYPCDYAPRPAGILQCTENEGHDEFYLAKRTIVNKFGVLIVNRTSLLWKCNVCGKDTTFPSTP